MPVLEVHDTDIEAAHADERPSLRVRRIVARTDDGELVHIGTAPNLDSAVALARRVIDELEATPGSWAVVGDRLLQPRTIVALDVLRAS